MDENCNFLIRDFMEQFRMDLELQQLYVTLSYDYSREYGELAIEVLCSERLSQMTKTYNDIECVTRLLEEKERDLELAAKIGQTLLESNKEFKERNETLEEKLGLAIEKVKQLNHDLALKDNLLRVYITDYDLTDSDGSPCKETKSFDLALVNTDSLNKKVKVLEEENIELRLQADVLKTETDEVEIAEQRLVKDCVRQLDDAQKQIRTLQDELTKKSDDFLRQQEESTQFLAQVVDMQKKLKSLTIENIELQKHLCASQDSQKELTAELKDLQNRHDECLEMFMEAQEDIKALRRKHRPRASRHHYGCSPFLPGDSLASELEQSMKDEMGYPEGYSPDKRKEHNLKIFETARYAKLANRKSTSYLSIPGSNMDSMNGSPGASSTSSICPSDRSSMYLSDSESQSECSFSGDMSMESSTARKPGKTTFLGRPGIPGSNDLETAIRRLTLRRRNDMAEKKYIEESEERRKRHGSDGSLTPTPCRTPESFMSDGSGISGLSNLSGSHYGLGFRIPEKLQIVKPMEGSATLHQWQRLATPHLGGLLEDRPGVQNKGEEKIDLEDIYSFSDFEEDDVVEPRKSSERTSSVYTYTMSTVMHPSDDYNTQVSSSSSSTRPSVINFSDTKGTSTFSMSLGLASTLKERNLTAKTLPSTTCISTTCVTSSSKTPRSASLIPSPVRYPNIVTETFYDNTKIHPYSVYSTANTVPSSARPVPSLTSVPDFSHLRIIDKIKTVGLGNLLMPSSSTTTTMATTTVSMASTVTMTTSSSLVSPSSGSTMTTPFIGRPFKTDTTPSAFEMKENSLSRGSSLTSPILAKQDHIPLSSLSLMAASISVTKTHTSMSMAGGSHVTSPVLGHGDQPFQSIGSASGRSRTSSPIMDAREMSPFMTQTTGSSSGRMSPVMSPVLSRRESPFMQVSRFPETGVKSDENTMSKSIPRRSNRRSPEFERKDGRLHQAMNQFN